MFGFSRFFGSVPITGIKDLDIAIESIDGADARLGETTVDATRGFSDDFPVIDSCSAFDAAPFDF